MDSGRLRRSRQDKFDVELLRLHDGRFGGGVFGTPALRLPEIARFRLIEIPPTLFGVPLIPSCLSVELVAGPAWTRLPPSSVLSDPSEEPLHGPWLTLMGEPLY
jgi:hypothetical protein